MLASRLDVDGWRENRRRLGALAGDGGLGRGSELANVDRFRASNPKCGRMPCSQEDQQVPSASRRQEKSVESLQMWSDGVSVHRYVDGCRVQWRRQASRKVL